ncbi:uncharacterized protein LOC116922294 isoform X2 [Daphnia magna]|nr:uncharacterized protein LOC116922294 isoform X2 [Daphnia magna]
MYLFKYTEEHTFKMLVGIARKETVLLWIILALYKDIIPSQSLKTQHELSPQEHFELTSNNSERNQFLNRHYFNKNIWDYLNEFSQPYTSHTASSVSFNSSRDIVKMSHNILRKTNKRYLHTYKMEDVVCCLDSFHVTKNRRFHISFIGDSLTRNQFTNFISLIPDYDRKLTHTTTSGMMQSKFHEDKSISSKILDDLLVSFRWRAIINAELIADFKLWATLEDYQVPDVVFIGCTAHNMLKKLYNLDEQSFNETIAHDLLPALSVYLMAHPKKQLFWIIQNPTEDLLGPIVFPSFNNIIHVKKIQDYNNIVRQIFSGTRVALWDSINPVIEESIRACALQNFQRVDNRGYQLCGDFLHSGHQILSIGSQLILNHLCD